MGDTADPTDDPIKRLRAAKDALAEVHNPGITAERERMGDTDNPTDDLWAVENGYRGAGVCTVLVVAGSAAAAVSVASALLKVHATKPPSPRLHYPHSYWDADGLTAKRLEPPLIVEMA